MNPMLTKLATLIKLAEDEGGDFDETIPADGEGEDKGEKPVEDKQGGQPPQPGQPQEQVEDPGMPPPMPEETPEDYGARAAKAFLGQEIFMAAAQGDQAAVDIISRTAGHIAASVTDAASKAMYADGGQMSDPGMGEQGMPGDQMGGMPVEQTMQPQGPSTPEEEVADQIVASPAGNGAMQGTPAPQAPADAAPQGGFGGQGGQQGGGQPPMQQGGGDIQPSGTGPNGEPLYDEATVQRIIEMVRRGEM
jgi:hypothetical protein